MQHSLKEEQHADRQLVAGYSGKSLLGSVLSIMQNWNSLMSATKSYKVRGHAAACKGRNDMSVH